MSNDIRKRDRNRDRIEIEIKRYVLSARAVQEAFLALPEVFASKKSAQKSSPNCNNNCNEVKLLDRDQSEDLSCSYKKDVRQAGSENPKRGSLRQDRLELANPLEPHPTNFHQTNPQLLLRLYFPQQCHRRHGTP